MKRRRTFLLIICFLTGHALLAQPGLEGTWQRDDGSIYRFTDNNAILLSVGEYLNKGKFEINDIKIKDLVKASGNTYAGKDRINTMKGEFLKWDNVEIKLVKDDLLSIKNLQSGTITILEKKAKTVDARQKKNQISGYYVRRNDNTIYHFTNDFAALDEVGHYLSKGKFRKDQVKIRCINKNHEEEFLAEDRINDTGGNLLRWDKIRIISSEDYLTITNLSTNQTYYLDTYAKKETSAEIAAKTGNKNTAPKNQPDISKRTKKSLNKEMAQSDNVDMNIPKTGKSFPYRFALIMGNEDYQSNQPNLNSEINVAFAKKDAETFKKYAIHVLGVPEENIVFELDADAVSMNRAINKMNLIIKNTSGKAEVFVYYAGHGLPHEVTKEPYLIPVNVTGSDLQFAIKLKDFYRKLNEYPSEKVTVFIDACFSGGARDQGLIAARGVKIKPKDTYFEGNLMVFSASSGNQSSLPYKEKQHGLFTYYLLQYLKETKGDITYGQLADYLKEQVGLRSIIVNNKEQNPQTNVSPSLQDKWEHMKLVE